MDDNDLTVFNAISKFVTCLNECFGPKQLSLQLYNTILEKTTLSHKQAIQKHITLFKDFCNGNTDAIVNKDSSVIKINKVCYSDKIYIDFKQVFEDADKGEEKVIWTHILILCAYLNPTVKAKEILKKENDNSQESNFLTDIISKVEENVDADVSNPMEAVTNIMSSGVFTDLVGNMTSGLENGELDLGKLIGTVNNMVGSLTQEMSNSGEEMPPGMGDMMNNITTMMNSVTTEVESSAGDKLD